MCCRTEKSKLLQHERRKSIFKSRKIQFIIIKQIFSFQRRTRLKSLVARAVYENFNSGWFKDGWRIIIRCVSPLKANRDLCHTSTQDSIPNNLFSINNLRGEIFSSLHVQHHNINFVSQETRRFGVVTEKTIISPETQTNKQKSSFYFVISPRLLK